MRLWRNMAFAVFCGVVSLLASPQVELSASARPLGCDSGDWAFIPNEECPFIEFYDASCEAGATCGNDALEVALDTCEYYTGVYNVEWPGLIMEAFECTDPVESEPFDFSFVCVPPVYPCMLD